MFYGLAAAFAIVAGFFYAALRLWRDGVRSRRLVFKKSYRLFYAISALFGIRKQIFLVFGAWVLVQLHGVPVSTIALFYFIASTLGVVMRPLLGEVIDWLGERTVLAVDELLLLAVCLTYAFSSKFLPAPYDLWLLYGAYVMDSVLFALRVARTTYLEQDRRGPRRYHAHDCRRNHHRSRRGDVAAGAVGLYLGGLRFSVGLHPGCRDRRDRFLCVPPDQGAGAGSDSRRPVNTVTH